MKKDFTWSAEELSDFSSELDQIAAINQLNPLVDRGLSFMVKSCKAHSGTAYIIDRLTGKLTYKAVAGSDIEEETFYERVNLEKALAEEALQKQAPLYWSKDDHRYEMEAISVLSMGKFNSIIVFPLLLQRKSIGVITLYNADSNMIPVLGQISSRLVTEIDKAIEIDTKDFKISRLQSLINIMRHMGATLDREQLLRMIISYARELLNVEACSLFLVDENTGDLVLQLASNVNENINEAIEQIRVPAGQGIIGHVVNSGEILTVDNVESDSRHYINVDRKVGFETRSILAVPLFSHTLTLGEQRGEIHERIIGGLEAINKIGGIFLEDDKHLLSSFANQAATVLEIARLYSESNEMFLDVIKALTAAIDAKDPYTIGHSQRVSHFSVEIARELHLSAAESQQVRVGSLLHDVGKIGIPDAILQKSGQLNETEYTKMKEHAAIGSRIMGQVRMLHSELPAMAQHHERLDGKGYPSKLTSEEISLFGKIVAVADVFDAMTSTRPYRKALPINEAIEYIQGEADIQFDQACVDALVRAFQKGRIHTQKES